MSAKNIVMAAAGAAPEKTYIEDVFSTYIYTGNGSTQTITNGLDLAGKGGLVWQKNQGSTGAINHVLTDTARGASSRLFSNLTAGAGNQAGFFSFNNSGFQIENGDFNVGNGLYVSWAFRKAPKFFDVVTFTTSASGTATVSHSLGVSPGFVVIKNLGVGDWWSYHHSGPALGQRLNLANATGGGVISSLTSSTFSVGGVESSASFVAYVWAHDASTDGLIQCGSFTADGSGNATVSLGWEPQWLMAKATSTTGDWIMLDTIRGWNTSTTLYVGDALLRANLLASESMTGEYGNPTATGFDFKGGSASASYIYIAIRRAPMKTPTSGTQVFSSAEIGGDSTDGRLITGVGFSPELIVHQCSSASGIMGADWRDVLRGLASRLLSDNTNPQQEGHYYGAESRLMTGYKQAVAASSEWNISGRVYAEWRFLRAPGFFDAVHWVGNGAERNVAHSLGVAPELIIHKNLTNAANWPVYSAVTGVSSMLNLNLTSAVEAAGAVWWRNTAPSATTFPIGSGGVTINNNGSRYISYLFATLAGVSKVGGYTGTGAVQQVNCGFSGSGARFVLIKRRDAAGDWYVWDSARGIVAGNDPYILWNNLNAQVTTTDWIDPLSTGFELSAAAGNNVNINGATYLYLAIA